MEQRESERKDEFQRHRVSEGNAGMRREREEEDDVLEATAS